MPAAESEAIFACRPNILVSDLCASLGFYSEALGFRIGWQWSDRQSRFFPEGEHIAPGEPGTALVGRDRAQVILTQAVGAHSTWLHFDVHTSAQVDGLFEEWVARGVDIVQPPTLRAWGMYEMRLHDPDGHVLRVSSPPPSTSD